MPPSLTRAQHDIVRKVQALHARGEPLNIAAVRRRHPELLEAAFAMTPFWGWRRALLAAGIDYAKIRVELEDEVVCLLCGHTRDHIIMHLQRAHGAGIADYRDEFPGAECTSERWRAASFARRTHPRSLPHWEPLWSPEYVLDRIAEHARRGHDLNNRSMRSLDGALDHAARTAFGSWDGALDRAGVDPRTVRQRVMPFDPTDRARLLAAARQVAGLREPERSRALRAFHAELQWVMTAFFGSWPRVARAAGLSARALTIRPGQPCRYPDQGSVCRAIRRRARAGQPLHSSSVAAGPLKNRALHLAAGRLFGSWSAALIAAGITPVRRPLPSRYPTAEDALAEIRRRVARGINVSGRATRQGRHADSALYMRGYRCFGSWGNAVEAAARLPGTEARGDPAPARRMR